MQQPTAHNDNWTICKIDSGFAKKKLPGSGLLHRKNAGIGIPVGPLYF